MIFSLPQHPTRLRHADRLNKRSDSTIQQAKRFNTQQLL